MTALLALMITATAAAPLSEKEILEGADARIEQHRRGDALLMMVDGDDQPLARGVEVKIEQTRHAFLFGCNIFELDRCRTAEDNENYKRRFAELLNFATIPFYWWGYETEKGQPADDRTENMLAFCEANNIITKGHPLAWNWRDPKWLPDDPEMVKIAQFGQIRRCTEKFGDRIAFFDVVNEATHYSRAESREHAPKLTGMVREMGVGPYVRTAFKAARLGNEKTGLIINDYVTDLGYAAKVLEELVDDENRPMYDIIGIQSHQHGGAWPATHIWEVCERFAWFGKPLHFTETTFVSGELGWNVQEARRGSDPDFRWTTTPEGEARQAKDVEAFYTVLYSHPAVEAITWWDFTDQHSWQSAPAGLVREDMSPKPAYEALMKLVKGKWWTKTSATVGDGGEASFRGTYGDYGISAVVDGRKLTGSFTFTKDSERPLRVVLK